MVTLFNIGLSKLSRLDTGPQRSQAQEKRRAEARRILSLMVGGSFSENDIETDKNGRPFFKNTRQNADFNISHSGEMAAVSYASGSNLRTGCDIEKARYRANLLQIAKKFFKEDELNYLKEKKSGRKSELKFYEIWTLKESFIKLHGMSVFEISKAPSFIRSDNAGNFNFAFSYETSLSFFLYELWDTQDIQYILAAVINGGGTPKIEWFSAEQLSLRSIAEFKSDGSPVKFDLIN